MGFMRGRGGEEERRRGGEEERRRGGEEERRRTRGAWYWKGEEEKSEE